MSKRLLRVSIYIVLFLLLVQCSGANFGGGGGDSQEGSNAPLATNDEFDGTSEPVDQPDPIEGNLKVYQASLINGGLSFSTVEVDLNIEDSDSPILLFVHLLQPTVIHLSGDVEAVQAIFLSSNTSDYDLPTSQVRFAGGSVFPPSRVATGYFPNYAAGSDLADVIGPANTSLWRNGVEVHGFAESLGERKCFDLVFDTDFDADPGFSVNWAAGQACIDF